MIVGPAIGGLLIAGPGLVTAFAVDAVTYAASLAFLTAMRPVPPPDEAAPPSFGSIVQGLRYARSRQELIGTYAVDMVAMFFGMPLAVFPAMSERFGGPETLGLLYAAPAVGAFVATVASGWTGRVHRHGRAVVAAACVWGVGIVLFGAAPALTLALLGLAVAGGADMVSGIFRSAIWNRTPDALRGRLASIEMVSYASGPALGNAEAGLAASLLGVRSSVVAGGALCVVGVVVTAALLPRFVAYDARDGLPASAPAVTTG